MYKTTASSGECLSISAPLWDNMVFTYQCSCCSINIKLRKRKKINCPKARSVNFHTLSSISLKVEVLNQIRPSQCTVELCAKRRGYAERQALSSSSSSVQAKETLELVYSLHMFLSSSPRCWCQLWLTLFLCGPTGRSVLHADDVNRQERKSRNRKFTGAARARTPCNKKRLQKKKNSFVAGVTGFFFLSKIVNSLNRPHILPVWTS